MTYSVHVVCGTAVAPGFSLAGLTTSAVTTADEAEQSVQELIDRPGVGVVLLEEWLYETLSPEIRRQLARRPLPIVVPFPGPSWAPRPEGPDAYIIELLRQAIGYRVRLR